jgi:hypothetical protein
MGDCPNVEMRELLPERVAGTLSAADMARVDAHLATCEMCTYESTVIRSARRAMRSGAAVNVARISGAVAAATRTPVARRRPVQSRQWTGWRAAASIALVAIGATSVAVWNGIQSRPVAPDASSGSQTTAVASGPATGTALPNASAPENPVPAAGSPTVIATRGAAQPEGTARATANGLTAAGGLSDLTDDELESLLGDIGTLDATAFDEPQEIMPAIGGSETIQ